MFSVVGAFEIVPLAAFAQDLSVLAVFLISFVCWRQLKGMPTKSKLASAFLENPPPGKTAGATIRSNVSKACDTGAPRINVGDARPGAGKPLRPKGALGDLALSSVKAAEQQMMRHLEQREFTCALNMYRVLEREGRDCYFGEEIFSAFVQSAIRVGKVDVVERMLRTMKRNRISPSLQFWQSTLKMLSSRRHFSAVLAVHTLYAKQMPCDKTIYSCLINASLEVGALERTAPMLERYIESGVEAQDYVLVFRTYVAVGDPDAAEACFWKLGADMSTLMLNLLLLSCVNAKDPERAHRLLHEAHALENQTSAAGGGERLVDVVSYNTVVKGYSQSGLHGKAFECLLEMLARNLEPDDITFGTILDACIVDNDLGAANDVVTVLIGRDRPMDTVMCTLFLKGLVRMNCIPKALELYEKMKLRENAHPDIVSYSVLIKALVDQHDIDRALTLLEDMKQAQLMPDDIILTNLLEGCLRAGNHALGKRLLAELLQAGVKPSEFTLVTMLKLHGRCGAHREAYELLASWEEQHGVKPSVIHYTCIMSGCLRTKKYDQAWAAYELMCERGVNPDETAVSTLLPGLVAAHRWERVVLVIRRALMGRMPLTVPTETLNNALSQMLLVGGGRHAEQLQQMMTAANVPITSRNAKRLG